MNIQHADNGLKGRFFIEEEEPLAILTYTWAGKDRILIDHTEVSPKLKGTGAGKKLVLEAVAFARNKGIVITPLCPFARSVFDRDPELGDVL